MIKFKQVVQFRMMDDDVVRAYQSTHRNEWLKSFHRDFHAGFEPRCIEESVAATDKDFKALERHLGDGRAFLSGSDFGLAAHQVSGDGVKNYFI